MAMRRAFLVSIVCVLLAMPSVFGGPGTAAADRSPRRDPHLLGTLVKVKKVAPGLVLKRYVDKRTPRRTFVLVADLSHPLTLDVTLADSHLPSNATVSAMTKGGGALAGINGDFTSPLVGRPVHPFMQDAVFLQTVTQLGWVFAVSEDERQVFLDHRPDMAVSVIDASGAFTWRLDRWNQGPPMPGEIAGYSPIGGPLEAPPGYSCSVRLLPAGPLTLSSAADGGIDQPFTVDIAVCQEEPLARNGGVVLSAVPATDEAIQLLASVPGSGAQLHWSVGIRGVADMVGGTPALVENGAIVVDRSCSTGLCRSNPRTGIGVRGDGKILLVVVDGRQKRWSLGPTLYGFATIMKQLGAVQALNLDGGGSSTMAVNGEVVNRPSDGHERYLSNAVLVLPGPDPGQN